MKKFKGVKPLLTIRQQCVASGVAIDDYRYRKEGSDYICIGVRQLGNDRPDGSPFVRPSWEGKKDKHGYVMFNTVNGTFFGTTDKGVEFSSSETQYEKEQWFQALLSFFYVEK